MSSTFRKGEIAKALLSTYAVRIPWNPISYNDAMTTPSDTSTVPSPSRPFIVRRGPGKYAQAPRLFVRWREIHKRTGKTFAGLVEVVSAGYDKSMIRVAAAARPESEGVSKVGVVNGAGMSASVMGHHVRPTTDGIKAVARRLAARDVEQLDSIDARIDDALAVVAELRRERAAALAAAWRRARPIEAYDVRPHGDEVMRYVE